MPCLRDCYLFSYNLLHASGWALSLWMILGDVFRTRLVNGAYASAGELICLLQILAFVEVIHGAVGIVPSGVLFPLMQWGGKTHFVIAIVSRIPEVQELPAIFITFLVWSLSESVSCSTVVSFITPLLRSLRNLDIVIRYSHYALNCVGGSPDWLTFIRYNAFIVLYPIGVFPGEMWLMYQALPFIKKENLYADHLPLSYYNFVKTVLFFYPFLWIHLYLHLFKQRASKLRKEGKKKLS